MYGKIINGVLYVSFEEQEGYKPMVTTEAPTAPDGYKASFYWKEDTESFVQTWEIVLDVDDEEATAEDYENALADLGVRV